MEDVAAAGLLLCKEDGGRLNQNRQHTHTHTHTQGQTQGGEVENRSTWKVDKYRKKEKKKKMMMMKREREREKKGLLAVFFCGTAAAAAAAAATAAGDLLLLLRFLLLRSNLRNEVTVSSRLGKLTTDCWFYNCTLLLSFSEPPQVPSACICAFPLFAPLSNFIPNLTSC